jgi:hypothetical protein
MSSHGRSGGALIRPQHRNLISNKNHNCNAKTEQLRSAQPNMMVSQRVGNTSRGNGVKKQHFGGQVPHPSRTESFSSS